MNLWAVFLLPMLWHGIFSATEKKKEVAMVDPTLESPAAQGPLVDEKDDKRTHHEGTWGKSSAVNPRRARNAAKKHRVVTNDAGDKGGKKSTSGKSWRKRILANKKKSMLKKSKGLPYKKSILPTNITGYPVENEVQVMDRPDLEQLLRNKSFTENVYSYTGNDSQEYSSSEGDKWTEGVCFTDECNSIAEYVKNAMDLKANPCDDFYQFSCGGWQKSNPIPRSENEITAFTKLTKKIEDAIYELLKVPPEEGESEALKKARRFFQSCMDTEQIEKLGAKPAQDFIKDIGNWDLCSDTWKADEWDIYKVFKKLQGTYYPAPPFFTVEVTNDHLNSTRHLIKIDQSGLSLQREIYMKQSHNNIIKDYGQYMTKVAKLLGNKCSDLETKIDEILQFEKRLAVLTTSAEDKQSGTFRRIHLKELRTVVPHFPWASHLKGIFPEANISKTEVILATSPRYLYNMASIMKTSNKSLLSRYMVWQMLRDKISFLSKSFRKARAEFNEQMTGVKDTDPRWRTCTGITNDNMGVPIGTLYVKNYFNETTKDKTKVMIDEIIKSFKNRIRDHDWIDKKTRAGVIEKTDALVAKVGYATYISKPEELNKRFERLQVDEKEFFSNNLNVDKWIRYRLFNKLRKPVDKTKWPMFPQTINAMYQFYENEIVIPAGILQAPFFYEGDVPRSLSYGAIGSIIGHELTHGFDNTGRKFDKNGDIVKEWWSKDALQEFNRRAKCIEKQYSKYKVQNKHKISGKLTLGENIADNGGTKLSYDAYLDWLKKNGPEKRLPKLDFNNIQLFFIGYAQEYCANVREKTEYIATLSEIHAPSKFRVIGTLSNFQAFSNAFQCPKESVMNPTEKCEVW